MLNTASLNAAQAAYERIADAESHLRRHGASLCDLFSVFDAPSGFDAFCDLNSTFGNPHPNPNVIHAALMEIEAALSKQSAEAADSASRDRGFDASAALRWHGARISECPSAEFLGPKGA
jgi:hypothetical protein